MTHITINGINNRPRAPEAPITFGQSVAAGIALVAFVLAVLMWVAA